MINSGQNVHEHQVPPNKSWKIS